MDFYKQVFLRRISDNMKKKDEFPLFESVSEYYEKNTSNAHLYFSRYEILRDRIAFYKNKVMADLPNYLIDFESNMVASGTKIIYAEDADHVFEEILKIVKSDEKLFISQADILSEINLCRSLKGQGRNFSLVRLSDFPYSILPEPSSITIRNLSQKLNLAELDAGSDQVISLYKKYLLNEMFSDSVSVTGADFLVADPGSVVLLDNEGIQNIVTSFCKKHIVVAGIDTLIPSFNELEYFSKMLSVHSLGCSNAWDQMMINGPRSTHETDGPEELYVILVDNGRTDILKREFQRSIFHCIHCHACMALCPVFKYVNSFDGTALSGPLNCIADPVKNGFGESGFLSFACTLCGKCSEVCPSKINFQELILYSRKESVESHAAFSIDKRQMKMLKRMLLKHKSLYSSYYRFLLKLDFKKSFGQQKEFPDFGQKSFRFLWLEKNKKVD